MSVYKLINQKSSEVVVLKWILPDAIKDEKPIPGNSIVTHEFQIGSVGTPKPISFEAHEQKTGRIIQLNGSDILSVTPSQTKKTIFIQLEGPSTKGKY